LPLLLQAEREEARKEEATRNPKSGKIPNIWEFLEIYPVFWDLMPLF
jgi:hypothetical protein